MLEPDLKGPELQTPAAEPQVVVRRLGCVLAAGEVPALLERLAANNGLNLRAVWLPGDDGSAAAAVLAEQPHTRVCADLSDFVEVYGDLDLIIVSEREGIVTCEAALALIDLALTFDARLASFDGMAGRTPRHAEIWRLSMLANATRDGLLRRTPDPEARARLIALVDQQSGGRVTKRVIDVVLAAMAVVLTAPLMALAALAVRLDSAGPVLFIQERLGLHQQPFRIVKFRTMQHLPASLAANEPSVTKADDDRITRVGRFLRRSRLDELPQLLNVLRGEMSLVGPRPIRKFRMEELAEHIPFYHVRFIHKPGLTGTAQVYYKYPFLDVEHVIKFRYEFEYVKKQSFWYDLKLMASTVVVLIGLKGA